MPGQSNGYGRTLPEGDGSIMFWSQCVVLSFHDMRDTRLRMRNRHRGSTGPGM